MKFNITKNEARSEDETPIEWVKWYEGVNAEGSFEIKVDKIVFKENEDQPVFYLIDEETRRATSVFASHHPNAKFTDSTPHGVRLAQAIGRHFNIEGEIEAEEIVRLFNEAPATVRVEKTEKGILWTIV